MYGIRGLDPFGLIHALLGLAALFLGLSIVLRPKGTGVHRVVGSGYVASMLLLNVTALMIYDLYGRFGPFHIAALVSLATVAAGFVPVFTRRPRQGWMGLHANFMCWSYVGLVAAFVSEVAVRVPGVGFNTAVIVAIGIVVAAGALLIRTRVPRILSRLVDNSAVSPTAATAGRE